MTVVEFAAEVRGGLPFTIDIEKNECILNGKRITDFDPAAFLDEDGNFDVGYYQGGVGDVQLTPFEVIENCYSNYYHSCPTKNDRGHYFKAKTAEEMTAGELARGDDREAARALLEGTVLWLKVNNLLPGFDGWYWQSKKYPSLIILKKWVA